MTTTNDNIVIICHLVAMSLLAMWHLHCVCKGMGVGEGLCWLTNSGPLLPLVGGGVVISLSSLFGLWSHCIVVIWLSIIMLCPSDDDKQ